MKTRLAIGMLGVAAVCAVARAASVGSIPLDSQTFIQLAKKVNPSVVNISTLSTIKSPMGRGTPDDMLRRMFEEFFRRGGGAVPYGEEEGEDEGEIRPRGPKGKAPKAMSLGTGFLIDASGLILTNNHVVADADEIKINFTEAADEKPTDGEVVGRDPELDVALIRVKSKREMVPVALGDSDALEVGEYVMAVGNPFGQGHSVTHGIISAKGRTAPDFPLANYLQTDAPINPGNSGGPLVNLKGEVIGINNAIDQRAQGIGFAIPINLVKKVLPQLRSKGVVARGYIGVQVAELTPEVAASVKAPKEMKAPFVTHIFGDGPAEKAGIKNYDVILELNGKLVHSAADLIASVVAIEVGQSVPIKVLREGKEKPLTILIAQRPGSPPLAQKGKGESKKSRTKVKVDTGMSLQDLNAERARELGLPEKTRGVVVMDVAEGGAADRAGLGGGDVILEVDRKAVRDVDAFFAIVKEKKGYLLRVRRGDPQGREVFSVVLLDLKGE